MARAMSVGVYNPEVRYGSRRCLAGYLKTGYMRYVLFALSLSLSRSLPQLGAAGAEIKLPSGESTELKRFPLKPGVGQYIATHATLTARDFFLTYFYPSGSFTSFFFKTSPNFSCVGCG